MEHPEVTHPQLRIAPGLLVCAGIALLGFMLSRNGQLIHYGLGVLSSALLLGIILGNTPLLPRHAALLQPGLGLMRGRCLRCGIALCGLGIGPDHLLRLDWQAPVMALIVVSSTLLLAWQLGRYLGVDSATALLIGVGSAICGAAAIAAAQSVIKSRESSASAVGTAISTVVIFGTLSMYLLTIGFPWLSSLLGQDPGRAAYHFGQLVGLSVHELGHVVAAAGAGGSIAQAGALLEKMLRVCLLVPTLLTVGYLLGCKEARSTPPLFLCGFLAAVALSVSGVLPAELRTLGQTLGELLLAAGLAALGMNTRWADLRNASRQHWLLASVLWIYLLVASTCLVLLCA